MTSGKRLTRLIIIVVKSKPSSSSLQMVLAKMMAESFPPVAYSPAGSRIATPPTATQTVVFGEQPDNFRMAPVD